MDRKELIKRYLEAETTYSEEQELAASFEVSPPVDEDEEAVCRMLQSIPPIRTALLPDAGDEFDRFVRKRRTKRVWRGSLALCGIAACLLAVVLTRKPEPVEPESPDTMELLRQLQLISNLDPAQADGYEFEPIGDGFIMTARFKDGTSASYLLTPMDGGQTFNLVSLNH